MDFVRPRLRKAMQATGNCSSSGREHRFEQTLEAIMLLSGMRTRHPIPRRMIVAADMLMALILLGWWSGPAARPGTGPSRNSVLGGNDLGTKGEPKTNNSIPKITFMKQKLIDKSQQYKKRKGIFHIMSAFLHHAMCSGGLPYWSPGTRARPRPTPGKSYQR